jgi:adenine/guanine phosphoribosyltransferase-like PRPP-binding protein
VEKAGAEVAGTAFVIELVQLGGASRLAPYHPFSLVRY